MTTDATNLAPKISGWRLFCRAGDLGDQGVPLFHPLILPAFIFFLAGLVVTIVGWATGLIPLIGALVLVPLSMVYCMGIKSFHKDCFKCCQKCCKKKEDVEEVDGPNSYVGQENWSIGGTVNRRAMASPKRIGKRQSQLMAEKEKMKKANADLDLDENGKLPQFSSIDENKNGDIIRNGSLASVRTKGGSLPDVESPSQVELTANRSRSASSVVENEIDNKSTNSKTSNNNLVTSREPSPAPKDANLDADVDSSDDDISVAEGKNDEGASSGDKKDDQSRSDGEAGDESDRKEAETPPPPTYHEATNKGFVGDAEDLR